MVGAELLGEEVIRGDGAENSGQKPWPELANWEERRYGRNVLLIWLKEEVESEK